MNASARKVSVQFLSWLSDEEMMEQWKKTHPLFTVCVAVLLYSLQPRVQEYGSSVCPFSSDIIDTEAHLNLHIHVQSAENKLNVAWCPQHKDCCVLCGPLRSKGGRGWADSPETLPLHSIPHTLFCTISMHVYNGGVGISHCTELTLTEKQLWCLKRHLAGLCDELQCHLLSAFNKQLITAKQPFSF